MNSEFEACLKNAFNSGKTHAAYFRTDSNKDKVTSIDVNSLYSMLQFMTEDEIEEMWPSEDKKGRS